MQGQQQHSTTGSEMLVAPLALNIYIKIYWGRYFWLTVIIFTIIRAAAAAAAEVLVPERGPRGWHAGRRHLLLQSNCRTGCMQATVPLP
jgi:hypothetical protein